MYGFKEIEEIEGSHNYVVNSVLVRYALRSFLSYSLPTASLVVHAICLMVIGWMDILFIRSVFV